MDDLQSCMDGFDWQTLANERSGASKCSHAKREAMHLPNSAIWGRWGVLPDDLTGELNGGWGKGFTFP